MKARSTFKDIYEDHADMVFNLCLNYLQNRHDAEEVTQDVFVKVHEQLDRFREQASLKTWIYRIAINQCLDFLKAQKRQKRFGFMLPIFSLNTGAPLPISDFDHPGILLEDKEALQQIFEHINTLPERQKIALILKVMDDLSIREIGDIMQLSEKAIESLLSRAKKKLKKILDQAKD